jgi:hypothetical protein
VKSIIDKFSSFHDYYRGRRNKRRELGRTEMERHNHSINIVQIREVRREKWAQGFCCAPARGNQN